MSNMSIVTTKVVIKRRITKVASKFLLLRVWRFRGSLPFGIDNHGLDVTIRSTATLSGALEAVENG